MEQNRLSDEDYNFIYSRVPRVCVDLVVKTSEGILLTLRQIEPYKGLWHFPGGRIKWNETVEQAANRISLAEIGTGVKIESMLGYMDIFESQDGNPRHTVSIVLLVTPKSSEVKGSWQAEKIHYFKKMPEKMHPDHGKFLGANNLFN